MLVLQTPTVVLFYWMYKSVKFVNYQHDIVFEVQNFVTLNWTLIRISGLEPDYV